MRGGTKGQESNWSGTKCVEGNEEGMEMFRVKDGIRGRNERSKMGF